MAKKNNDRLDAADRKKLKDSEFGIPEKREFPLNDAKHVHSAEAYFRYASKDEKPSLARRIEKKGKELGVDVESPTIKKWAGKKQTKASPK